MPQLPRTSVGGTFYREHQLRRGDAHVTRRAREAVLLLVGGPRVLENLSRHDR